MTVLHTINVSALRSAALHTITACPERLTDINVCLIVEQSNTQDQILLQWSDSGPSATMNILVVHAMVILLTYEKPTGKLFVHTFTSAVRISTEFAVLGHTDIYSSCLQFSSCKQI